ncbi:MAG: mechanosensitive ion channel family protein, partial [Coriobacteriia bacterium]|nr:mechanosensitive ion channel family protein [Coriobacteriia bacterium]
SPSFSAFISTGSQVVAILAVTAKLAILAGRIVRIVTSRQDNPLPSSSIFVNLARGTIWVIGLLILLAALQVSIAPLVTALGVGGLAIGLALQPTLENLFGGVQVLMSRQIDAGDFIRLESGEEGWVRDVTWRNTTIQMVSNDLVIVPNALIAKSRIMNFTSLDEQHIVIVPVGVAFDSDLEHVEHVTAAVAAATQREIEGAVIDWEPPVRFYEFGDSAVRLRVVLRVERYDMRFPVLHAFIKRLHAAYAEENIEIPYPQTTVHMASQPEL